MSTNSVAIGLMARSSNGLDGKMGEIRWVIATLEGLTASACSGIDRKLVKTTSHAKFIGIDEDDWREKMPGYSVRASLTETGRVLIEIEDPSDCVCDLQQEWESSLVDFIHDRLDDVVDACKELCTYVGREKEWDDKLSLSV